MSASVSIMDFSKQFILWQRDIVAVFINTNPARQKACQYFFNNVSAR